MTIALAALYLFGQPAAAGQGVPGGSGPATGAVSPVDGTISDREYPNSTTFGEGTYDIYRRVDGDLTTIGLRLVDAGVGHAPGGWPIHAGLMGLGVIMAASAIGVARRKKRPNRLKVHTAFQLTSLTLLILGLIQAVISVVESDSVHFDNTHSYFGVVGISLVIWALFAGYMLKSKSMRKFATNLRWAVTHRSSGWIALGWIVLTAVLGLIMVS